MNTCLILNGYVDGAILICKNTSLVNGNKEREMTPILILILIFIVNDKSVAQKW